jgi:hypothetical protein
MENGNTFERRTNRIRELLATLPEPIAQKLAYENVMTVYRLPKVVISQ